MACVHRGPPGSVNLTRSVRSIPDRGRSDRAPREPPVTGGGREPEGEEQAVIQVKREAMVPPGARGTGEVPAAPTPAPQLGHVSIQGAWQAGQRGGRGTWGQGGDSWVPGGGACDLAGGQCCEDH